MNEDFKSKMDDLLKEHSQAINENTEIIKKQKEELEQLISTFEKIRREIIIPTMKEYEQFLKGKGESAHIDNNEPYTVKLNVNPSRAGIHGISGTLSFALVKEFKHVFVSIIYHPSLTQGQKSEKIELGKISKEYVSKLIEEMIESCYSFKY
ncbi:MAG: hypothetical protein WAL88_01705 [Nitrosotalea sp.]